MLVFEDSVGTAAGMSVAADQHWQVLCVTPAGGSPARVEAARAIVEAGVAVMGHVGLTPQSVSVLGEWLGHCSAVDVLSDRLEA